MLKNTCRYLQHICLLLPGFVFAHTNNEKLKVRNNCNFPVQVLSKYSKETDHDSQTVTTSTTISAYQERVLNFNNILASNKVSFELTGTLKNNKLGNAELAFSLNEGKHTTTFETGSEYFAIADPQAKNLHTLHTKKKGEKTFTYRSKTHHELILTTCPNRLNFGEESIIDGVKRVLVFGDQFTDEGNLLSKLPKLMTEHYYHHMLSNGEIWSSHLRHDLIEHGIKLSNYSFGYATACLQKHGERGLMALSSEENFFELNKMAKRWKQKELQHDLAIIWIGQNDYFREVKKHHKVKPEKSTSTKDGKNLEVLHNTKIVEEVIASIERTIDNLLKNGIKKIVVINLPELSLLPVSQDLNSENILYNLSQQHNEQLKQLIDKISVESNRDKFKLIDIQPFFMQLTTEIEQFNQKYNTGIVNTTGSCWNPKINNKHNLQDMFKDVEDKVLTYFIQKILNFWKIGANLIAIDGTMCDKPEEYAFLGRVNFTKEVHQALYRYISQELGITIERQQPAPQKVKVE